IDYITPNETEAPAQTGYDERYRRSNNKTGAWRQ
ncbi:hypothetical protein LTSEALA_5029, partial [Salmonella enterica subsp. enterica serovar Alachua str. R6-377]